nr:hypothetical protein [uncultured Cohaesibacter sp.]
MTKFDYAIESTQVLQSLRKSDYQAICKGKLEKRIGKVADWNRWNCLSEVKIKNCPLQAGNKAIVQ